MKIAKYLSFGFYIYFSMSVFAQPKTNPTFEDILSLQSASNVEISPDDRFIVYQVQSTDWEENRYDRELWISDGISAPYQLTNTAKGNSNSPQWSPDSKWIGFTSTRNGKNQLFVIRAAGGEAIQITTAKEGIGSYKWSPDGSMIAYTETKPNEDKKEREELYGKFSEDDMDFSTNQLWIIPFNPSEAYIKPNPSQLKDTLYTAAREPKLLTEESEFYINSFSWSPEGKRIAVEHQPNSNILSFFKADISILEVESKTLTTAVSNKSYDGFLDWSPDGNSILFSSNVDDNVSNFYKNERYFIKNLSSGETIEVADEFDENIFNWKWHSSGLYGLALDKTQSSFLKVDPTSGDVARIKTNNDRVFSFSIGDQKASFIGSNNNSLRELFLIDLNFSEQKQITDLSQQINQWNVADSEVISWKSKDGSIIEGILHKPKNYDASKKYPLMVVIHGGPTGISIPEPTPSYVYPIVQWLNKGALVLRPNYRGSAGYGGDFRALNVKNLGVGDAWDVESGVAYLHKKGIIDIDKVASMGWSQGGYISAFLSTNSTTFKAISVGAGISNWMTYYVNTDIHPFTRQYLKATPWSNEAIYKKTSPMTNIKKASTPTLIQHGEFDTRVPVANAYELYQGLQDNNVESRLIIYKGFGHGISKPKERLAATWHNWQWINKYLWVEDVELPTE